MRFSKVLLVPVAYYKSSYRPGDIPDLALGYIAEYLASNGVDYDTLDMNLGYTFEELAKKIESYGPDLIGVAMKSYRYKDSYAFIEKIKRTFPTIPIAVGAAHVSTEKQKVMEECPAIDYGVVKEGEDTLLELCRGKPLAEIKGLLYREDGNVVFTGERLFRRDIMNYPWPKYQKFELKKYWYPGMMALSSRGCPESCTFCAVPLVSGKWWRFRTPESMVEEIKYWYEQGYRRVEYLDDNFTLDQNRIMRFCDLVEQSNFKGLVLNVPQGVRADRVNPLLLQRMRKAGFISIAFGVEVGNERMLKAVKKGESMETIEKAIQGALDAGFDIHLNMMVGFPDQALQDVEDTFNFALKYPIRWATFNNFVPYLGTEGYETARDQKLFLIEPEEYLNEVNPKSERIIIKTPHITPEQREYIEKKIPRVQEEIRKRYHVRRLNREYGLVGKVVGRLYHHQIIPAPLFNWMIKLKNEKAF